MKAGHGIKFALTLAASWAVCGVALAQGPGYWPSQGGGYGPGGGYGGGPGYGMGQGQGGWGGGPAYGGGPGPGGMGRFGGGPGYAPGQAMGHGTMGGPGHPPGPGMMQGDRGARLQALGLNNEQRAKIDHIREQTRSKNWDVIGQIRAERFKLREMYRADKVNAAGIVDQQRKVDDLRRQVLRARLEARNQVFALLTPEQRQKARSFGPPRGGRGSGR